MDDILENVLPYSEIVGQNKIKLALELAYIAPRIGGVLISGQRGTAKSTTVRAFAIMMHQALPVTIPINATEDRVIGGWQIARALEGKPVRQAGLIQEANHKLLYIDEVNLLDDHIVNILLDVTSTGKLIVQREGRDDQYDINLTLVGTMNPEEGGLRPQLLDRFGLMVDVSSLTDLADRQQILETILRFDQALLQKKQAQIPRYLKNARQKTQQIKEQIEQAQKRFPEVELPTHILQACVRLGAQFGIEGHRADYLLALAAQADAARNAQKVTTRENLLEVAELVLRHRLSQGSQQQEALPWNNETEQRIVKIIDNVEQYSSFSV